MRTEDLIEIKTKACSGPYVKREAETFMAIKLPDITLAGYNSKLHMHVYRIDMLEREIIPLKRIDTINGLSVLAEAVTQWEVIGSKGNKYTVNLTGKGYTCTCPGYTFRKTCKHIEGVK